MPAGPAPTGGIHPKGGPGKRWWVGALIQMTMSSPIRAPFSQEDLAPCTLPMAEAGKMQGGRGKARTSAAAQHCGHFGLAPTGSYGPHPLWRSPPRKVGSPAPSQKCEDRFPPLLGARGLSPVRLPLPPADSSPQGRFHGPLARGRGPLSRLTRRLGSFTRAPPPAALTHVRRQSASTTVQRTCN